MYVFRWSATRLISMILRIDFGESSDQSEHRRSKSWLVPKSFPLTITRCSGSGKTGPGLILNSKSAPETCSNTNRARRFLSGKHRLIHPLNDFTFALSALCRTIGY
jgi:hypothetical protein